MGRDASTIVFFPARAFGPLINSVGIGDVLRRRGYRVVFIVEESFAGTLEERGFEERLVRLGPRQPHDGGPGAVWKGFLRDREEILRMPPVEQLTALIRPAFRTLIDGAKYVDDRLLGLFAELKPRMIVVDNAITFPALFTAGVPWTRLVSRNPAEMKDHLVPPPFSGLSAQSSIDWDGFWVAYRRALGDLHDDLSDYCQERGAPPLHSDDFIHESPWLNLYLYPDEVDYSRARPLGRHWRNLQANVRCSDPAWNVPEAMSGGEDPLIYLSLGSLGSADVDLMRKLIAELANEPYRVVVAKGPQAHAVELASNMEGAEFLPQASLLPKVDLVITNAGSNTIAECLFFGRPMVMLPIFWDQHDNAQRLNEKGFGVRLDTYEHQAEELTGAIDRLLTDRALEERLAATSARLRAAAGTELAADLIERAAREG